VQFEDWKRQECPNSGRRPDRWWQTTEKEVHFYNLYAVARSNQIKQRNSNKG
jgi:hypothetical protein